MAGDFFSSSKIDLKISMLFARSEVGPVRRSSSAVRRLISAWDTSRLFESTHLFLKFIHFAIQNTPAFFEELLLSSAILDVLLQSAYSDVFSGFHLLAHQ